MILLASFPRSGNTFLRNILWEVYGLQSNAYPFERDFFQKEWVDRPFCKTHLLPKELPREIRENPTVYLVRDGRDTVISMAHQRKDIIDPESDFEHNLKEAILADGGSHFGGWSHHVASWIPRADIIIKYEDLIQDPLGEAKKIEKLIPFPESNEEKLPTFQSMRDSLNRYGGFKNRPHLREKFFRRGVSGAWKDEMPEKLHKLFWKKHRTQMVELGYTEGMIS